MLAIVGGTLAIKANRGGVVFCYTVPARAGNCTITIEGYAILPVSDPNAITKLYCTTIVTRPCLTLVGIRADL